MESLEERINKEIGIAMKDRAEVKLSALRAVKTAIQKDKRFISRADQFRCG